MIKVLPVLAVSINRGDTRLQITVRPDHLCLFSSTLHMGTITVLPAWSTVVYRIDYNSVKGVKLLISSLDNGYVSEVCEPLSRERKGERELFSTRIIRFNIMET